MYREASWQIYNCIINSNISFDKGAFSFGEWWCLQVPHQVDGGKNAHPLRFHSMTDLVERKRIKTWSHQIISTCFFIFFLLVKIISKGPLCSESSFTGWPLLPRKTVLWMCAHILLAIFVKIIAAWVNQEERHCFSPHSEFRDGVIRPFFSFDLFPFFLLFLLFFLLLLVFLETGRAGTFYK